MTTEPRANATAPFGLLLDVDGPIANPATREMSEPGMATALAGLANAGIPTTFNTGRGTYFLETVVVPGMLEAGLDRDAPILAATEKGAIISRFADGKFAEPEFASDIDMPEGFELFARALVASDYADAMAFDEHKDVMVSIESYPDLAPDEFRSVQADMNNHIAGWLEIHGYGFTRRAAHVPNEHGELQFRIDEHVIGTDIEPIGLSKALGAERLIANLQYDSKTNNTGALPSRWYTVGDSRSDYTMADWLHEHGFDVVHVDVRSAEGVPEKPYPILTSRTLVNDAAGVEFLQLALEAAHAGDTPQPTGEIVEHHD